jgi:hypothetical protein
VDLLQHLRSVLELTGFLAVDAVGEGVFRVGV